MTSETEHLIQNMAGEAGNRRGSPVFTFEKTLLLMVPVSLAIAVVMVLLLVGLRPDFSSMIQAYPFHYKVAVTVPLLIGAFVLVSRIGHAGGGLLPLAALLPGVAVIVIGAATDQSGFPLSGHSDISVPACLGAILMISLPAFVMALGVLRSGVPVQPRFAGAAAGVLAGAVGAAAYTLACKNDGALFVAVWYSTAILIMASLGAVIGRRVLAW